MDCSECILLIISFCCAGGMSSALEKMVYGSLEGPTLLSITPELQDLTVKFSDARWKRSALNGGTKTSTFLASYDGKNYTNYMKERIKFHPKNFSLEILKTARTDAGHYEYTVNKRLEEQSLQFQLEVYERVSVPNIQMVSRILGNESCSMNLSCVVDSGDNVTYSWNCSEGNISQLHPYNGSFLYLSFTPGEGSISCSCTARNRVSQQTTSFSSSVECSNKPGGSLRNELLEFIAPIVLVGVLVFGAVVTCWLRHRGQEEHSELKEEKESCTIYSQVQRVEQQKSSRPAPVVKSSECTTIYVSATGLPPDVAQQQKSSRPPPVVKSSECTTIYVSATGLSADVAQQQKSSRPPPVVKSSECTTIYVSATGLSADVAQQQKSSCPAPVVKSSECTTIYVSATGLSPDVAQPPNPEPTTIYDTIGNELSPSPGNVQNCSCSGDTDGLFPCPQQKPISPADRTFTHDHTKSHLAPQKQDKTTVQ